MAQVAITTAHPKHDVHKFCDIKPKLGRDNWISWKRELLATARDRGLYSTILGSDTLPSPDNQTITMTDNIPHIGTIPLSQLVDEWNDRNNVAYNQILLCITPELQTTIDDTDIASEAWKILTGKFESTDPSKISIIRTKYENYHMTEGQSVITYITVMKEFRNQLKRMGENVPDSTHAATLLRNVPESWRPIAQTIWMITRKPDEIEECLEAHEADLNALEISVQAGTAFAAQTWPIRPTQQRTLPQNQYTSQFDNNRNYTPRPTQNNPIYCNNCGRPGHPASRCYVPGRGLAGQAPWRHNQVPYNNVSQFPMNRPMPATNRVSHQTQESNPVPDTPAHLAGQMKDIIMMATAPVTPIIPIQSLISSISPLHNNAHTWLIDSAASSHISGNLPLFFDMVTIAPVTIQTASGDSFMANQSGTIRIKIKSDPSLELPDLHITLTDVIYVPSLCMGTIN